MSVRTFVDSNVLIYAYDIDAGPKHEKAEEVLQELWNEKAGIVSPQVLQEFYVNAIRKIPVPLPKARAREVIEMYSGWCVETTYAEVSAAFRIEDAAQLGFWDSLVIASAVKGGASRLLTEDLNPGQEILGVRIENPFAGV